MTLEVGAADGPPRHVPENPPSAVWWPLEESLVARGNQSPIYTFVSQFSGDNESPFFDADGNDGDHSDEAPPPPPPPPPPVAADVDFLRGLNLEGLTAGGAADAPLRRLMVSPAAAVGAEGGTGLRYGEDKLPTPATLVADLKATANFKSAITDLNGDGSDGPLSYLGYHVFSCADEVHEDEEKQYVFATPEDLAEVIAEEESEAVDPESGGDHQEACAYREVTLRSRAQLAALKKYVLKQRVFFVLIHTDRKQHAEVFPEDASSDVVLLALGVSPTTGNLVGVIAVQVCKNLCD